MTDDTEAETIELSLTPRAYLVMAAGIQDKLREANAMHLGGLATADDVNAAAEARRELLAHRDLFDGQIEDLFEEKVRELGIIPTGDSAADMRLVRDKLIERGFPEELLP